MTVHNILGFHEVGLRDHAGRRMYCGRYALIAATGVTSEQITTSINTRRGRKPDTQIMGTTIAELKYALRKAGVGVAGRNTETSLGYKAETFAQWRRNTQRGRGTYIILITNHWIVVRGDWLIDTFHRGGHDLRESNPYARKRVQATLKIDA